MFLMQVIKHHEYLNTQLDIMRQAIEGLVLMYVHICEEGLLLHLALAECFCTEYCINLYMHGMSPVESKFWKFYVHARKMMFNVSSLFMMLIVY